MTLKNSVCSLLYSDIKKAENVIYHKEDLWEKYRLRTVFVLDGRLCRLEQHVYEKWDGTHQNILDDRIKTDSPEMKKLVARQFPEWIPDDVDRDIPLEIYYAALIRKGFVPYWPQAYMENPE